jgi:hypothetical protein
MLLEFAPRDRDDASIGIEEDGTRRGRTLVDGQNVIGCPHGVGA